MFQQPSPLYFVHLIHLICHLYSCWVTHLVFPLLLFYSWPISDHLSKPEMTGFSLPFHSFFFLKHLYWSIIALYFHSILLILQKFTWKVKMEWLQIHILSQCVCRWVKKLSFVCRLVFLSMDLPFIIEGAYISAQLRETVNIGIIISSFYKIVD